MSQSQLVLVWDRDWILGTRSKKKEQKRTVQAIPSEEPKRGIAAWANANQGLLAIGFALIGASFFFGSWYMKSDLGPLSEDVRDLKERLERIEGRVDTLFNRAKAIELGFKNPQIAPIKLTQASQQQIAGKTSEDIPYILKIKVQEITQDHILFAFSGRVDSGILEGNTTSLPRQVGAGINLKNLVQVPGMPDLWIVIIDLPTKDTAIIAVGAKTFAPS